MQQEEFVKQQESWSVARLLKRGHVYGSGGLVALRGNSRVVNTQMTLRVLTEKTLKRVVGGGGPEHQPGLLLFCWRKEMK